MPPVALNSDARPVAIDDKPTIHLPGWRRWVALFTVCWMTLPMNFATSSVLAAAPEVAAEFSIPATTISIANAGVFLAMAASPLIWVPIARLLGRRTAYLSAACVLCLCSVGSALAPNMATFTAIWVIGGTIGVVFLVYGQTILSDLFEPVRSSRSDLGRAFTDSVSPGLARLSEARPWVSSSVHV